MQGIFILVVGPSGSGKGVLISHIREQMPELVFPVSCTTRAPRAGEESGQNYHFITDEDFDAYIARGEFLEWAEYGGNRYGTLVSEVIPALNEGKIVFRELEVQGVRQIMQALPKENVAVIFIDAGSWEDLEQRILDRAPISEKELHARHSRFDDESSFASEADVVVHNGDGQLEQAKKDFVAAVLSITGQQIS